VRGQVLPQDGHIVLQPGLDLTAMDFPERLATLRNERGMTQGTLAEHVGIHVSQLRRYEAGSSSPTLDALRKLAIALSVSADTLIFDAERNPQTKTKNSSNASSTAYSSATRPNASQPKRLPLAQRTKQLRREAGPSAVLTRKRLRLLADNSR